MALAYSRRLSRRSGTCPVQGVAWDLSSVVSSQDARSIAALVSSGFSPGGGIRPPLSFLMVASQTLPSCGTESAVMVSNATLPAQSSVLWHLKQCSSMIFQLAWASLAGAVSAPAARADPQVPATAVNPARINARRELRFAIKREPLI